MLCVLWVFPGRVLCVNHIFCLNVNFIHSLTLLPAVFCVIRIRVRWCGLPVRHACWITILFCVKGPNKCLNFLEFSWQTNSIFLENYKFLYHLVKGSYSNMFCTLKCKSFCYFLHRSDELCACDLVKSWMLGSAFRKGCGWAWEQQPAESVLIPLVSQKNSCVYHPLPTFPPWLNYTFPLVELRWINHPKSAK